MGKVQPGEKEDRGTGECSQVGSHLSPRKPRMGEEETLQGCARGCFRLTVVSNSFMERFEQPWHRLAHPQRGLKAVKVWYLGQHFGLAVVELSGLRGLFPLKQTRVSVVFCGSNAIPVIPGLCSLFQDAHNCIPELDSETAMFSVYDGHGGNCICLALSCSAGGPSGLSVPAGASIWC